MRPISCYLIKLVPWDPVDIPEIRLPCDNIAAIDCSSTWCNVYTHWPLGVCIYILTTWRRDVKNWSSDAQSFLAGRHLLQVGTIEYISNNGSTGQPQLSVLDTVEGVPNISFKPDKVGQTAVFNGGMYLYLSTIVSPLFPVSLLLTWVSTESLSVNCSASFWSLDVYTIDARNLECNAETHVKCILLYLTSTVTVGAQLIAGPAAQAKELLYWMYVHAHTLPSSLARQAW